MTAGRRERSRGSAVAHELVGGSTACLNAELLPALRAGGVRLVRRTEWTAAERTLGHGATSEREVLPVLTPIGLDPGAPVPARPQQEPELHRRARGHDAFGRDSGIARAEVPRSLPRLIQLPP